MTELDARLQLTALDLPGHGESPILRDIQYDTSSIAIVVAKDLAARGYRDVVLVGHSAGGLIALKVAVAYPGFVRGIVLLDTTIALTEAEIYANQMRSEESDNSRWRLFFMSSMINSWGVDCPVPDDVIDVLEQTPECVARPFWHSILNFKSEELWRTLSIPALYVRSKRETDLTLLSNLNSLISTTDLRPCCRGHWPHLQCPGVVNEVLSAYLAELGLLD